MAEFGEENKVTGVFGGIQFENNNQGQEYNQGTGSFTENATNYIGGFGETQNQNAGTIQNISGNNTNLPVKNGFWNKFKAFWLQDIDWNREIKVELTPAQQKVENEINEFLHQEITWNKVHDFLFQEVSFGKK